MYKNEMEKEIVFFMPSFEGGGVEKNIEMIANFFASKKVKISLISWSYSLKYNSLCQYPSKKLCFGKFNILFE